MKKQIFSFLLSSLSFIAVAQQIPSVYSNFSIENDTLIFTNPESGDRDIENVYFPTLTLEKIIQSPKGSEKGIDFDFQDSTFSGNLYYGFVVAENVKYPQPVWFGKSAKIVQGKTSVSIAAMKDKYDIIHWQQKGYGLLGYRLENAEGKLIYEGQVSFAGVGPFETEPTIIEGPFINLVTAESVTVSFKTSQLTSPTIVVNDKEYQQKQKMMNPAGSRSHQILIDRLKADTTYSYKVMVGQRSSTYHFTTAPKRGSHHTIRFAFASDSREGKGGGERSFSGTNAYMMKKIGALSLQQEAGFMQFTGDLISGYCISPDEIKLQYANWKKSVEPIWHYFPIYTGIGNHEALITSFGEIEKGVAVDKFPFGTQSTEKVFMDEFCNPLNGPESEDGSMYDVDKQNINFPTYKENVYYYMYGNMAMVVLNTDYWYAPSTGLIPVSGGNPHSFIMDQQLAWLAATLARLESDITIDHVFVSLHSPVFPNGGHASKSMWFFGNNDIRPFVSGNPTERGIIERRDQLLDLMVNKSKKVVALLCGDEHNYSRMLVSGKMEMYPEDWDTQKLTLNREIWQITNGSAGSPYYGQEQLPWSSFVEYFTPQYALVLVDVEGTVVKMKVINPDTLETIEEVVLK